KSVFKGEPDPVMGNQKITITAPVIYPIPNLYDPAGGLFIDEEPEVKMEVKNNAEIRYTIDGSTPTKSSELYSHPFKLQKSAVVTSKAFLGDNEESNTSTAYFRVVKKDSKNGVEYTYYEGKDWQFIPVFEKLNPIKSGNKYEFRIDDINQRQEQFGIQFKAK